MKIQRIVHNCVSFEQGNDNKGNQLFCEKAVVNFYKSSTLL